MAACWRGWSSEQRAVCADGRSCDEKERMDEGNAGHAGMLGKVEAKDLRSRSPREKASQSEAHKLDSGDGRPLFRRV